MIKSFNRQRKIVSLLLSLAMILTALPLAGFTAFAEDGTHTSGDFEYRILEDGTAEITDYTGDAEMLEIPSNLNGYTVTSIGDYAFEYCVSLTSVSIPDSITSIGFEPFVFCGSLTEIKVDANNENFSSQNGVLFDKNITELIQYPNGKVGTSYDIPDGVTNIGDCAFEDCDSLTNITIPDSVTSIDGGAFASCDSLTSVTIPDSVTSIGDYAFGSCDSLTSITIPESVTSIGYGAFHLCSKLAEITVDTINKNYSSQDGVLFDKNKTELIQYPIGNERISYSIPDSVISIYSEAFAYCDSLTSVTIPNSVTSIDNLAFAYCESLTSVTIPESVTSIGEYPFFECYSLTEIKVDTNNKNYTSQDGVLFNKNKTELIQYPIGNERISYSIPDSVISIYSEAFAYCDSLTSVSIPDSVKNIGDFAFWGCISLASITIPNSVTIIGDGAFYECYSLTSVTIGNSVTSIGEYAFDYCNSLTDIYILNKDCNIVLSSEDYYTIPTETTIHGYAGSTAETFAKENGNKFVAIEGEPVIPDPDKQNAIGDVDGNKNITITDAKWILQNTVKSRTFTEAQAKAADLNKDGKITIVDAKWVLQIVVGLRDAQTLKPIKK